VLVIDRRGLGHRHGGRRGLGLDRRGHRQRQRCLRDRVRHGHVVGLGVDLRLGIGLGVGVRLRLRRCVGAGLALALGDRLDVVAVNERGLAAILDA
jgi:hypothetical protein